MTIYRKTTFVILLLFFRIILFSQKTDTIKVFLLGEFEDKEKYLYFYNDIKFRSFTPNKFDVDSFNLFIDTLAIKNYMYLPLKILKSEKHKDFEDTRLNVIFDVNKKILLIERDYRVKNKFAISYRWLDRKREIGILPEVLYKFMNSSRK